MEPRLWISSSGEAPHSVALSLERTVVGRSPEADVVLEDEGVSWNHLEIERKGEVLMATDLDSRNGTALNGEPLDRPRRLRDGDTLIVGGYRLEVKTGDVTPVGATVAATEPAVALNEEERATAAALAAPYRSEGAFAGRLDALAAKLDIPGDAGRDRPRQIAARVIELGLDRPR
jgi:predicted component of type VI protein secretion system